MCMALLVAALTPESSQALDKYLVDTDRFPGWKGELPSSLGSVENEYVGYGALGEVSGSTLCSRWG